METKPEPPPDIKALAKPSTRLTRLKVCLAAGALLVLAGTLVVLFAAKPFPQAAWLSPDEISHTAHPGPLTRLRNQLSQALNPLWRIFHRTRIQVNVTCKFFAFPVQLPEKTGLPAALAAKSDGSRIWVLSPEELETFRKRFSQAIAAPLNEPWMTTVDGGRAQIYAGGSPPFGTNEGFPTCSANVTPRLIRDSFRLTVGITATQFVPSAHPPVFDVKTNLYIGFSALVKNGGGVLLISGATNASGQPYGTIISPVGLDSSGHPLKL